MIVVGTDRASMAAQSGATYAAMQQAGVSARLPVLEAVLQSKLGQLA